MSNEPKVPYSQSAAAKIHNAAWRTINEMLNQPRREQAFKRSAVVAAKQRHLEAKARMKSRSE